MKIKAVISRMLSMCPEAWYIFIRSLQLSCVLLILSAVLLIGYETGLSGGRYLYELAGGLYELPQALLLIGAISSVCIEDVHR